MTGCHEWQLSLSSGYGQLNLHGDKPIGAHRFAWIRANGPIPDGLHVLHRCDNRRCVNVEHLFLGTNLDNIQDMNQKGRASGPGWSGERNPVSRLSWDQVLMVRALCSAGFSQHKIAKQFCITQSHVSAIALGKAWQGDGTAPETRRDFVPLKRYTRVTVAQRFDELVNKHESGCWLWTGWKNPDGYGKVRFQGRRLFAHRFSYERVNGLVPHGLVVRHTCDQRSCVNPDHLVVGTQADNIRDMVSRGRQRSGWHGRAEANA